MRKDFYVFRHGETDLNKQKRWQGSGEDYDLNATGVAQAELAVNKLKEEKTGSYFFKPFEKGFAYGRNRRKGRRGGSQGRK